MVRSVAISLTIAAFLLTQATGLGKAVAQTAEPPAAAFSAPAQSPVPQFHGLEGLIKLDVVVTDSTGKAVIGLGAHDFTVLDNGQPTGIASFSAYDGISAKPDPPVELILAIDLMNISSQLRSHAKAEVNTFLRRDGGHLAQPVVIYTLTGTGLLLIAGPSTDGNALAAELAQPTSPEANCASKSPSLLGMGRSSINANLTIQCLGRIATLERQKLGRKLMIWVGPGSGVGNGDDWTVVQDQQLYPRISSSNCSIRLSGSPLCFARRGSLSSTHPWSTSKFNRIWLNRIWPLILWGAWNRHRMRRLRIFRETYLPLKAAVTSRNQTLIL